MFDWMSLSTSDVKAREAIVLFCDEHNIDLETKVSQNSEILDNGRQVGRYRGIKITILKSGFIKLMFSVHKLYNELHSINNYKGEPMNHDTFDIKKMAFVINWLGNNFEIAPSTTIIHQLEFGFNLSNLSVDTDGVLQNLISFKGKRFSNIETFGSGNGRQVSFSQYRIKFYDKSLQNNLPYSILRIEFKALKIQPIKGLFINVPSLDQLLLPSVWHNCKMYLLHQLESVIIGDQIPPTHLIPYKPQQFLVWFNPIFWETCKADKRSKNRKVFDHFILKYGLHQIRKLLTSAINREYERML